MSETEESTKLAAMERGAVAVQRKPHSNIQAVDENREYGMPIEAVPSCKLPVLLDRIADTSGPAER
jgi:hypothetical protein